MRKLILLVFILGGMITACSGGLPLDNTPVPVQSTVIAPPAPTAAPPVVITVVVVPTNAPVVPTVPLVTQQPTNPNWPVITYSGFPTTPAEVITMFAMTDVAEAEVTGCPDFQGGLEKNCWRVLREKDGQDVITPFWVGAQPYPFWLDGYRHEAGELRPGNCSRPEKSGIPPGFSGLVEGIVIRPVPSTAC